MPLLVAVCLLTFLHYVGAQMRGPILPLYAAAHGATATGVGFIVAAHMAVAAGGSIPLGRTSDVWGRRPLLLGGMAVTAVTSPLLPLFEGELAGTRALSPGCPYRKVRRRGLRAGRLRLNSARCASLHARLLRGLDRGGPGTRHAFRFPGQEREEQCRERGAVSASPKAPLYLAELAPAP